MSIDVFSLHCSQLPLAKLVGFRGSEQLSQPFQFNVYFTVPESSDVKGAIGAQTTLTANREDAGTALAWHGMFVSLRLLHQTQERALYHGLMVPKLWLLRHFMRSHVQTKKGQKVKDFTAATLVAGGLADGSDFKFDVHGSYPAEELVCQYRETHLDFVHRWFEREGLYYYFQHANGTSGTPKMMVVDEHSSRKLIGDARVRYVPQADSANAQGVDCFTELSFDMRLLPANVAIVDHNYANPAAPVNGKNAIVKGGHGELHEYGYRVFDSGEAQRLAQVRAQSIACRELTLHARGNYLGLRPGYDFELEEGPSEYPSEFQVLDVHHAGVVAGQSPEVLKLTGLAGARTYEAKVTAIPKDIPFRAPQISTWPRIYGFEHGTVDGKATSSYAQIDDQGRYLVRFHFDTNDLPDGETSTYLRMLQPHGGNPEGFHFPLRKGTEVMVAFLGGDPDRPVIASVAPDAHRPSLVTGKNHTQNILKTGGKNHMVIEDLEGKQSIDLYTPSQETNLYMGVPRVHAFSTPPEEKTSAESVITSVPCAFYLKTCGTAGFDVAGDWWQNVGTNYLVDVAGKTTVSYNGNYVLNVNSPTKLFYNDTLETEIKSGWKDTIVTGGVQQKIEAGGWKQEVTGNSEQAITGELMSSMSDGWKVEHTPKVHWDIGEEVHISAGHKIHLEAPEVHIKVTSFHGHWEPHKFEMIGLLEEFIGNKAEVVVAIEEAIGAEAVFCGAAAHFYGAFSHISGAHFDNHLAHVIHDVAHLKEAVTKLENTPATIINSVTFIKNTAILVIA
jgi:type VI secretion system secreted protein VgrG